VNNGPPVDEEGSGGSMYDICDDDNDDDDNCDNINIVIKIDR
jgi:hypothetical protein